MAGLQPQTCRFYQFPNEAMDNIRGHGSIPVFSWGSESSAGGGAEQPDFQLADIAAGRYDADIRQFATEVRDWGHPFFLRFNWEMNGNWFPWSEGVNGNGPASTSPPGATSTTSSPPSALPTRPGSGVPTPTPRSV